MQKLTNGLRVFNATPHPITFHTHGGTFTVQPDTVINATPVEVVVSANEHRHFAADARGVKFVRTEFVGTDEGRAIIAAAQEEGADVIVGSIIAAQAYPGQVVAMTPAPGYERVPPAEKRMNPDKFTIF